MCANSCSDVEHTTVLKLLRAQSVLDSCASALIEAILLVTAAIGITDRDVKQSSPVLSILINRRPHSLAVYSHIVFVIILVCVSCV